MLFDRVNFFFKGIAVHVKKTKGRDRGFFVWVVRWGLRGGLFFKPVKENGTCKTQFYPNAVLLSSEIVTCSSVTFGGTIFRCSGINKVSELMKTLTWTSPDLLISFKSLWSLNQDCLHTFIECID